MDLKPLGDKIIIRVLEEKQKTKGGIILPDTAREKPQEAKVLAVGTGKVLTNGKVVKPDLKVGDTVLFGKYAGNEVKLGSDEVLILSQDDVLAIIREK